MRDYVHGHHDGAELKQAHRGLVQYFRATRPKDAFGRPKWDHTLAKQDKITGYICEHAQYHIMGGWDKTLGSDELLESDELAVEWLGDTPQVRAPTETAITMLSKRQNPCPADCSIRMQVA